MSPHRGKEAALGAAGAWLELAAERQCGDHYGPAKKAEELNSAGAKHELPAGRGQTGCEGAEGSSEELIRNQHSALKRQQSAQGIASPPSALPVWQCQDIHCGLP